MSVYRQNPLKKNGTLTKSLTLNMYKAHVFSALHLRNNFCWNLWHFIPILNLIFIFPLAGLFSFFPPGFMEVEDFRDAIIPVLSNLVAVC